MPSRIVREAILTSEPVNAVEWRAELFYRRLLSVVDDYGRFEAAPSLLRAKCYPLQVDRVREADISRWMAACQTAGLIVLYSSVDHPGKTFLYVVKFGQQQRSPSKYPAPTEIQDAKQMLSNAKQVIANAHLDVSVVGDVVEGVVEGDRRTAPGMPEKLNCPEFLTAWESWEQHRKEIRHALTPTTREKQLKAMAAIGVSRAVQAIGHSIEKGYQGIYEPKENGKPVKPPLSPEERKKRALNRDVDSWGDIPT